MMQIIGTWIAAGLTLAIFSFLYKDNPFYKFAEHLYVGVSAAYAILYVFYFDVKPLLIEKFISEQGAERWIILIPAAFGLIMLARWIPKISWLSRWSIALTVGIAAGLGITGQIQGILLPQIRGTLVSLTTVNNAIMVIGVIATLIYFYFSIAHQGVVKHGARLGMVFIMVAFGASFGYTVMARISLLIGRLHFLVYEWLHLVK
ncbi:MAG: hypothetical protein A2509_08965 [Candidatus Edwardsbacteria bacterium RIFOXYD12_FULL_50_11]|jgi:hypothetical protein|uniref:Uncharacterized protein n=1 Tax=Candidatus Edwardsbacteria bacterium GWF2_54_11 TaxID=1817851 RepID=A0A1F5R1U6_9BACT|nr:MAG: hypothetical protein A2502_02330 [Candidatus Edwardsbacteria bacterium RifOxyC12_full_54_24]OGF08416.1 MAG: hypothetical protein A2024_06840 [Candidatus Edwardsbacteria bacterium GWF2_54_11]OGF09091.1 MAG: hypothetical protein A2273_10785 [Candidatus Edwardsbacteria bacterium RifOxyA12_full_54_48]OGF12384.1 MAG: hypothetical protein A3K15_00810 [Candidatus Edwardsbacteria bacterium GWE2_54_12]OGF17511.1 MAG: hypothetical protein A2509_08965 [Candidatus Edwardsbacteria bacterium RIFOXYD1